MFSLVMFKNPHSGEDKGNPSHHGKVKHGVVEIVTNQVKGREILGF
jgi:hypothetical protein